MKTRVGCIATTPKRACTSHPSTGLGGGGGGGGSGAGSDSSHGGDGEMRGLT